MLNVEGSRELQAVALTMAAADKLVRSELTKEAKSKLKPVWQAEIRSRATTRLATAVLLPGAAVSVTARQVTLRAATRRRPLRGGLVPFSQWPGVELGMRVRNTRYQSHSRKGKPYTLTRAIGTQFRNRMSSGRGTVVFPAAQETGAELVAMMVRSIVETLTRKGTMTVTGGK